MTDSSTGTTTQGRNPDRDLSLLDYYDHEGIKLVRLSRRTKRAVDKGWPQNTVTLEDMKTWVRCGGDVGWQCGEDSGWISAADLDWEEARKLAPRFLTDTLKGAKGEEDPSQYFYRAPGLGYKKFAPIEGLDEIIALKASNNGRGHLVVVAPSVHKDKGPYHFVGGYNPAAIAHVEASKMRKDLGMLAVAALVARLLPPARDEGGGGRHDIALALAGYTLRNGESEEDVAKMLVAAWEYRNAPREAIEDVRRAVRDTGAKIARGEPVIGGRRLEELIPRLPSKIADFLSWENADMRDGREPSPAAAGNIGITKLLADAILAEDHFAQDTGGKLYRFSGGAYRQYAERYIRRRVKEILEAWAESSKWSSHRANEVVEYIRTDAPELWERPPLNEINVLNGILNVETRELRTHDPVFLSPIQIPVEYDPSARCPEWEKFVGDVFPEDTQELAFELSADLITPNRSAQKAILLLGEGSNGKSTYLRALTAFVGATNVAGASLHKLESDRFATARLIGKLANICPDLPSTHLTETSVFKAITGGDDLHAEYKYRESFEFRPYCRLVFSANHVPRSGDASHAFFRRWLVVHFERTFEPAEQTPREELDAKLADPRELSGVLNRALEVLPRVRREGFTESESMREAWEEFKAMTDPVSVWLENNTVEHADALVPKAALLAAYNQDCEKQGRAGMTGKAFGQALKRARPRLSDAQRTVSGKLVWCWVGLGLRQDDGPPDGSHGSHDSRDSRDSTNCFENGPIEAKEESGGQEVTNKEDRVNRVNRVNASDDYDRMVEETRRRLEEKL